MVWERSAFCSYRMVPSEVTHLFSLLYASSATEPLSQQQMTQLLACSREANAKLKITGMLLYKGGNFMQVLEGPEDRVLHLYARIVEDRRHHSVITLLQEKVAKREFPQWSMGFDNLDSAKAASIDACAEDIRTAVAINQSLLTPSRALQLLATFIGMED